VDVRICKFEAKSVNKRRFRFRATDCEAITGELGLVDWHGLISREGVDLYVDIFYDVESEMMCRTIVVLQYCRRSVNFWNY
jgi:hypothetical protein